MMRIVPTPARASREASAEPVAPQPTMAMRDAVSLRWPSAPIPRKSTCREYLSSSSKEVISSTLTNYYDGCHVLCKTEALAEPVTNAGLRRNVIKPQSSAGVQHCSLRFHRTRYRIHAD